MADERYPRRPCHSRYRLSALRGETQSSLPLHSARRSPGLLFGAPQSQSGAHPRESHEDLNPRFSKAATMAGRAVSSAGLMYGWAICPVHDSEYGPGPAPGESAPR